MFAANKRKLLHFRFPFAENKEKFPFSISSISVGGNMEIWRHGDMEAWRHEHMEMKTKKH
jgi:hypothetical protein